VLLKNFERVYVNCSKIQNSKNCSILLTRLFEINTFCRRNKKMFRRRSRENSSYNARKKLAGDERRD
jgi:hypothetical protein